MIGHRTLTYGIVIASDKKKSRLKVPSPSAMSVRLHVPSPSERRGHPRSAGKRKSLALKLPGPPLSRAAAAQAVSSPGRDWPGDKPGFMGLFPGLEDASASSVSPANLAGRLRRRLETVLPVCCLIVSGEEGARHTAAFRQQATPSMSDMGHRRLPLSAKRIH